MAKERPYDVVLLGATGFTGRQAAHFFAEHAPSGLRYALAGRSMEKLEAVKGELGGGCADIPLIQVDTADQAAVDAMVASTRVLLTTVGPYAQYGSGVLGACARWGTDYVDITGETLWVRKMIDAHHEEAVASGARIVPFCGFDSIPSDLGTFMVAEHMRQEHGVGVRDVRAVFTMGGGGLNGGTLQSALGTMRDPDRKKAGDPFLLNPRDRKPGPGADRSKPASGPRFDESLGLWTAPFIMAEVNTRVVRRSDALLAAEGEGYGDDFAYTETMRVGSRAQAYGLTAALYAFALTISKPAGRKLVERFGPEAGEGPSIDKMDKGFFRTDLLAVGDDGTQVRGRIVSQGDPGNRSTVRMLCASALCLAVDRPRLPKRAGVLTPATAFGHVLISRLKSLGMKWEVMEA